MKDSNTVKLTSEQNDLIRSLTADVPDNVVIAAILKAFDMHQGPFEYSGRPEYLIRADEVPYGFWEGISALQKMHLSSGPKYFHSEDGEKALGQSVDPNFFDEILSVLLSIIKKILGIDDEKPCESAPGKSRVPMIDEPDFK